MVSCVSKLPVLDWTAAEAANLFCVIVTYVFFLNLPIEAEVTADRKRELPSSNFRAFYRAGWFRQRFLIINPGLS